MSRRGGGRAAADEAQDEDAAPGRMRLDKWLWVARLYKSRSLARTAIESGHVRVEGERSKVGREVGPGTRLLVRQGWDERELLVRGIDAQRRGAPEARQLYEETAASLQRRETLALQRRASAVIAGPDRPSKKDRRDLARFKRGWSG